MHKYCSAIGAWLVLLLWVFASPCAAEDVKVTLVEVQGNKRIETATVLAKIKTKEGEVFSPALIKVDIKALYQLGHFEDVQVKTEGFENGLKVVFIVREKPLLREIIFQGNYKVIDEDLKEVVTLLPRTVFNLQLINEYTEKIRAKYQDKGYYDAVVVPVVSELRGGDRNLTFYIEEGKKVILKDVVITGNKAISSKEIKSAIKNQEHWFFSFLGHSGTLRREELKEDMETISNLYYNKGYIQVQVNEPIIEPKSYTSRKYYFFGPRTTTIRKNELVLRINIKEGDQFRVGDIALKGNFIISDVELEKEIQLKKGDIFSRELLRQDVGRIIDRYDSIARPFADVIPQFNINPGKKTVALTIDIREGGEVRIGRINIAGNSKTRDKVIRREMRLDEGDLYSKKSLKRSYERLNNLNFFETVDLVPERRQQESLMDLNVKIKEKPTGSISVGGGYSSVDKIMGMLEVTQGNLFGRGQVLKFRMQMAQAGTRDLYDISFMEPYLFDKPIWGKVDIYKQTVEYDGYDLDSTGFGLAIGKSYGEYVSTSLKYGFDESKISLTTTGTGTVPVAIDDQLKKYGERMKTSALTWTVARDSRDFYLDPKTGSKNSFFIEYAGGPLGGDPNFYKAVGDSAWYFPMFWDTVFMVRGRVGYIDTLNNDKPIPLSERFYVGGPTTVHGFRYGACGPIDANDNRVGGNQELIFNFVYSFPIVPAARLKGVLFYDIGRAFDDNLSSRNDNPKHISLRDLRMAWGWGIWWFSPLGPLKFDFGYIMNKKQDDQENIFDFSIGALF